MDKLKQRTEEFILIFLIIVNFLDFFKILPGDLDFFKKIISWSLLGYLFYHLSLSKLFFGSRNKFIDVSLIVSYFLLIAKNLTSFAAVAVEETSLLKNFYEFLIDNAVMVQYVAFYIGGIALILLSLYLTLKIKVKKPKKQKSLL